MRGLKRVTPDAAYWLAPDPTPLKTMPPLSIKREKNKLLFTRKLPRRVPAVQTVLRSVAETREIPGPSESVFSDV